MSNLITLNIIWRFVDVRFIAISYALGAGKQDWMYILETLLQSVKSIGSDIEEVEL